MTTPNEETPSSRPPAPTADTPPVQPPAAVPAPAPSAAYEPPRLIRFEKLDRLIVSGE